MWHDAQLHSLIFCNQIVVQFTNWTIEINLNYLVVCKKIRVVPSPAQHQTLTFEEWRGNHLNFYHRRCNFFFVYESAKPEMWNIWCYMICCVEGKDNSVGDLDVIFCTAVLYFIYAWVNLVFISKEINMTGTNPVSTSN